MQMLSGWRRTAAATGFGLAASLGWGQGAAAAQEAPQTDQVLLTAPRFSPEVYLSALRANDGGHGLVLSSLTTGGWAYPVTFGMPVLVDGRRSEKLVRRLSQETFPGGQPPPDDFTALSREVLRLAGQRRFEEAVPIADRAVAASDGRPLALRMLALSNAGYVKRFAGDLAGAADSYRRAVAVAEEAGYEGADLGVVLDNLARVLSAEKDYLSAEVISLRAIRVLGQTLGQGHLSYGGALNNLALMYHEKGDHARALEYSNRAIDVLRVALAGDRAALQPFLEDNKIIKAGGSGK